MKFSRIGLFWAFVALLLHLAVNGNYGFFRDELYFIICGRHPAFGYVDQPSLTPLLAALTQSFGVSVFALRVIPGICAAIATYAACVLAVEFGGGAFAEIVAGASMVAAPEMLALGFRLSPDTIEFCTWPVIALWTLRVVRGADPRWWLAIGAVTALAMWSKYTVIFFVVAIVFGLLVTPQRRTLLSPWFGAGALLTIVLVLPNFLWQMHNGFPILQLLRNDYGKFLLKDPPFPLQQIMIMSPLLSVLWITGLVWLLYRPQTCFLGIGYLALIAMMWALQAKNYYPGPVYPYLLAAGAVPIEQWTRGLRFWRVATVATIILLGIPSAPFVIPVLPMRTFVAYQETLGNFFHIRFHVDRNAGNNVPIQYYADMTGWPELAQTVAAIYHGLPRAERTQATVFTHNFGEAAAIELYAPRFDLPPVLSGNNNYWIWGTRGRTGNVLIDVNGSLTDDRARFTSVQLATIFRNPYAMPYENHLRIYVCRGIHRPLATLWPKLRNYSYGFDGL